ncbi:MAG: VOC family protein [Nanoarchaeota archaeon]
MINSVNHLSFTVADVTRSMVFYRDVLGLSLINLSERDQTFSEKATGIPGARLHIAYLLAGNCSIELIQYLSPKGTRIDTSTQNIGSAHICFNIANFDDFILMLKKNKVQLTGEPQIVPAGPNKGRKAVYAKDPDSNNLEFISIEKYL